MSLFTTEVRFICESLSGLTASTADYETVLSIAADKIFNFDFEFYDETKKKEWEIKFLRHFYTREISAETYGLWHLWLQDRILTLMPKYTPLYRAIADGIEMYVKHTYTENEDHGTDSTGNTTSKSSTEGENTGKETTKRSDTPQGTISDLESDRYMSEAEISDAKSGTKSSGQNELTSNDKQTGYSIREHVENSTRTQIDMFDEFRQKFANLDAMFYNECDDLFMQYYGGVY